jgi:DNA-binding MarR family transcriptional regulator
MYQDRHAGRGCRDRPFDAATLLRSVRRLEQRLSDSIDGGLEEMGLTSSLYLSLEELDREPRVHASQLARNLGITRQSVHAVVVKLRRMDLVELLPVDLGVRGLLLTDLGQRRLALARNAVHDVIAPVHAGVSPRELDGLAADAERCVHALRPRPMRWWLD